MNSKAIKRQLLAAIAMVLVAALALGSSTYAWFVQSGEVTATGMNINVQSTGGLLIKFAGQSDGWGAIATASPSDNVNLKPTSTCDMETWCTAIAAAANDEVMKDDTIAPVTIPNEINFSNDYVLKRTFYIRATGNSDSGTKGLYVKEVEVTGKGTDGAVAQELNMALRVGIVATSSSGNATFIMAPVQVGQTAKTSSYTVYKATGDSAPYTKETAGTVTIKEPNSTAIILDSDAPVPGNSDDNYVTVAVYVWYEGEDGHLYSDNINAEENLSISLTFATNSTSSTGSTQT